MLPEENNLRNVSQRFIKIGSGPNREVGPDLNKEIGLDPNKDIGRDLNKEIEVGPNKEIGRDLNKQIGVDPNKKIGLVSKRRKLTVCATGPVHVVFLTI